MESGTAVPAAPQDSSEKFIIQDIMPAGEIHLIGGPSGSGKTTLAFQLIDDWKSGKDVFGYKSYPAPICYVACFRSAASTRRTMRRLGVESHIPVISIIDRNIGRNRGAIVEAARKHVPEMRVMVIDAIGALCPGGKINDYATVSTFLTEFTRQCQNENLTVIGIGHTTKTKEGEKFENPRQRFLGTVAWGGFADTMIMIEPSRPDRADDLNRTVMLLPRNERGIVLDFQFDKNGRLTSTADMTGEFLLDTSLATHPEPTFRTKDVYDWAEKQSIGRRGADRWIIDMSERGKIEKIRNGVFRKVTLN